ncbi:EGF-like and EMI domain-containing protein 1 [Acomys russatus]|uniref:EGF-like and EMI domain-containing protein 1 n=1 Tax=Acomys russatus TaxID=60746 RepID=UPI0021E2170A|nr:EGF-like and EMI domain-containing protein 1 [Acomys russatus]
MTSPPWVWCFCIWAAANWPPGSALHLQPGMPIVCKEEQLMAICLSRPCVGAFIDTVKFWKQGCSGPRGCVGYERRTCCYTIYRHVYATEHQTVFRCCPGWSRWDDEPGCFFSVSSLGTHFRGRECSEEDTQQCRCSGGFQGPHCQYDINECAIDNGGCQDQCCNTIGSYYCRCQAGQKLDEDSRAYEGTSQCLVLNQGCQQRCINTQGTFHCECDTGYRRHADGRTCIRIELEIVNVCEKNNGGCSHHCEPAIGGPRCSCNYGHQLDTDEKTCIDFDECKSGEACCAQLCINYLGGYECACQEGFWISPDGCGCGALDDEQSEEEEVELGILSFPGLLVHSPPQPFPYLAPSLAASYEDKDNEDEHQEAEGEFQSLTALQRVVCLDGTFGLDCSLNCGDCMNGGRCQEGKSGCFCPAGWTGSLCNESNALRTGTDQQAPVGCRKGFFGKYCKRKCHCANNGHCHRVYGGCMCDLRSYGRFCHLNCPGGAGGGYGAACSLECHCVKENTLGMQCQKL